MTPKPVTFVKKYHKKCQNVIQLMPGLSVQNLIQPLQLVVITNVSFVVSLCENHFELLSMVNIN